ncbi:MAG: hypothetical protein ACYC6P_02530 [Ignavibacteriaceae bacterium]
MPPLTIQIIILFLFVGTYLTSFIKNKNFISTGEKLRKYLFYIILFIISVFITTIINYGNVIIVIKSLIQFGLTGLFLFLAIIEIDLSEKNQEQILKFIYSLLFLQILVTAFQFFILGYRDADSVGGTISSTVVGGTGIIAFIMSFLLAFGISQILIKGLNLFRLFIVVSSFIPPLLGGARISLILFPLTIIITVISFIIFYRNDKIKKSANTILVLGIMSVIMFVLITVIVPNLRNSGYLSLDEITTTTKIDNYDKSDGGRYNRLQGYNLLFNGVFKNNLNIILGMGNQAITTSNAANVETANLDFINYMPDALIFLASNGILGLSLIISIILISLPSLKNYLKVEASQFFEIVALSLIPVTFNIIFALFYTSTWNSQIGFTYWIILAILFHRFSIIHRGNVLLKSLSNSKSLE